MKITRKLVLPISFLLVIILLGNMLYSSWDYNGSNSFVLGFKRIDQVIKTIVEIPFAAMFVAMLVIDDIKAGKKVVVSEEKESPDKRYVAYNYTVSHGGALGDCFEAVNININKTKLNYKDEEAQVFYFYRYTKTSISWESSDTLLIICDSYNKRDDIIKSKQKWKDIKIVIKVRGKNE